MRTFELAITDFCNLNCALCSQGTPYQKNKKTMTMDEIVRVSRHILPFEFPTIKISGGEPTLHPQFGQICDELRYLFKSKRYELATNGFRLESFIDRLHVFDAIYLTRYPGKNDEIIERFEKLKIPNINIATKKDYDTMEDVYQRKNLNKTQIFKHCSNTFPKLVQGRIYACCVIFGQSIRQNINVEEISVPADENWRQNLKQIDIEKYCRQCFVDVKVQDTTVSRKPEKAPQEALTGKPAISFQGRIDIGSELPVSIKNDGLFRQAESKPRRKGLTIFAMPKAFAGHTGIIQRNAIKSWTLLEPRPEIILMGNDAGVAQYAAEMGLRHIAEVRKNEFGTPLVSNLFARAQEEASNDVLMYINSDIILLDDFQAALEQVRSRFDEFLMVGQRWNTPITSGIDFGVARWREQLREFVCQNSVLFPTGGIDYFVFTHGLWSAIPDFGIGRSAWDNWLVWKPINEGKVVVDATDVVMAIHQDHEYIPSPSKLKEEAKNRSLCEDGQSFGFTSSTAWKCTRLGVVMRNAGEFLQNNYSMTKRAFMYIEKSLSHDPHTVEKDCRHAIACMLPAALKHFADAAKTMHASGMYRCGATLILKLIDERRHMISGTVFPRGVEYLREGHAEEALKWFDMIAGFEVPNLNYARAVAFSQLGKYGSARQACLDELKLQPGHDDARTLLAQIDAELKKEANELCMRGLSKMQNGDFVAALADFESAVIRCFETPMPNLNYAKAVALSRLGKLFSAQQACLEELKFQPGHAGAAEMLERLNKVIDEYNASKGESKMKAGTSQQKQSEVSCK